MNFRSIRGLVSTKSPIIFPKCRKDLDKIPANYSHEYTGLPENHPGYTDFVYQQRRQEVVNIARDYKYGKPIPRVNYNNDELNVWRYIYNRLHLLYEKFACKEYLESFELLKNNVGYSTEKIPQLETVSQFLMEQTNFQLRPVGGLISSRDFLNGLALRTFHSTQYIRHHIEPSYTPEPDVCHELLGHVPLLANKAFADFSQLLGLYSLEATDEQIRKLSTLYWFTVEFGLCKEINPKSGTTGYKAYGAGLLSSYGEMVNALRTEHTKKIPLDISVALNEYYDVNRYQRQYYYVESLDEMKENLLEYGKNNFIESKVNIE